MSRNNNTSLSPPQGDITPQRQAYASSNNTIPQPQEYAPRNSVNPHSREYVPRNGASIRPVIEGHSQETSMYHPSPGGTSSKPGSEAYNSLDLQKEDDAGLIRQSSIPRKQVGTFASTPYSSVPASSPPSAQTGQSRQQTGTKPLPSTPAALSSRYIDRPTDSVSKPSGILNRSRPMPPSQTNPQDAQDVVDRAKTNTYDTEVIETVAPGQFHH